MGRKIPGAKHRGVKDPVKQQEERKAKLKTLINAPPSNPNMQELPKSVLEMNRLRELVKSGNFKKKKRKKKKNHLETTHFAGAGPKLPGMNQKDLDFPKVTRKPGESNQDFLWRLDLAANDALDEANLEVKHNVVMNRNKNGEVVDVKPMPKYILDDSIGKKKPGFKTKSVGTLVSAKDKLSYLKEKKLKKKLKKIHVNEDELEKKKDYVKFGEVVHRPPEIKKRPRGCDAAAAERPGKKNLLLKNILQPGSNNQSMLHQKQIASAREEAMKVYKEMKEKNRMLARH